MLSFPWRKGKIFSPMDSFLHEVQRTLSELLPNELVHLTLSLRGPALFDFRLFVQNLSKSKKTDHVLLSPSGHQLLLFFSREPSCLIDLKNYQYLAFVPRDSDLSWSPDEKEIALISDGRVTVQNLEGKIPDRSFFFEPDSLLWTTEGWICLNEGVLELRSPQTGEILDHHRVGPEDYACFAYDPYRHRILLSEETLRWFQIEEDSQPMTELPPWKREGESHAKTKIVPLHTTPIARASHPLVANSRGEWALITLPHEEEEPGSVSVISMVQERIGQTRYLSIPPSEPLIEGVFWSLNEEKVIFSSQKRVMSWDFRTGETRDLFTLREYPKQKIRMITGRGRYVVVLFQGGEQLYLIEIV